MVFLVEDFVNLPADQIANIWLAAHMKRKLGKKDIKKTKLGAACKQLHSDKTKKPMQLRHYGQCLMGISWIHYKQVEYLHTDCNEAVSKARLVLVRKRKVDLDPSKDRARDITLPEHRRNGNQNNNIGGGDGERDDQLMIDIDLNGNNLINMSQLYMNDDAMSDIGSLLGTDSHSANGSVAGRANLALDHEITMQQNELSTVSPSRRGGIGDRRSSFGGISSLLMGDMDIEIKFDDDDDNENDDVLDESQAQRASAEQLASLTDNDDDNGSVEQGRGAMDQTLLQQDNLSDNGSLAQPVIDGQISLLDDTMSLTKEKPANLDDLGSAHSGSVVGDINANAMDIDDQSVEDQQSLHVQFDLDAQSVTGSVATAILGQQQPAEQATPPPSPDANRNKRNAKEKNKDAQKQRNKKKRKRKKKFTIDTAIELDDHDLREREPEDFDFIHPTGRDAIHIWREFPLSTLDFDALLTQPLSKHRFNASPKYFYEKFEECNKKRVAAQKKRDDQVMNIDDPLADPNILRDDEDIEQGRDQPFEPLNDISLPMNDFPMADGMNLDESMNMDQHSAIHEPPQLEYNADDNVSTIDSVVDDNVPPPEDPLFDKNLDAERLNVEQEVEDMDEDQDDDLDILNDKENIDDGNRLSFDTGDQDKLTQTAQDEVGGMVKLRDWSRRARKTFAFFKNKEGKQFSFNELMKSSTKKDTVVGVFYELLVFKNSDLVDLQQDEPYGDIIITKTKNFDRHARLSQKVAKRISEIQQSQQQE